MIDALLDALNDEVMTELSLVDRIAHPGENGRAREGIISNFLRRIVPAAFGISTGFVVDTRGSTSKQTDIIVHWLGRHPVFVVGGVNFFPIEGVAAVIENKAAITSVAVLTEALEAVASVKRLERTSNILPTERNPVMSAFYPHQVFGAIIAQRSLTERILRGRLLEFLRTNDRTIWPNFYVTVDRQAVMLGGSDLAKREPSEARFLLFTPDRATQPPPLVQLASELCTFLAMAERFPYRPSAYLGETGQGATSYEIQR